MRNVNIMTTPDIRNEIEGIRRNPPTMDFMVDFTRTMARLKELEDALEARTPVRTVTDDIREAVGNAFFWRVVGRDENELLAPTQFIVETGDRGRFRVTITEEA